MKRLILVVIVICFLAGVVIITTGKLQSQNVQTQEKIKQDQTERPIPPKPSVKGVGVQPPPQQVEIEGQKIFRLKVWIKSEQEQNIVERIGLPCQGKTECLCHATEEQVEELKKEGIEFEIRGSSKRFGK
jgi:hypothetical protein